MALSFPQHQPSLSTLWLCHKSPSAALHAKRGRLQQQTPTAAAARATPQHPPHQHWKQSVEEVLLPFWNAISACPSKDYVLWLCREMRIQSWGAEKSPMLSGLVAFSQPWCIEHWKDFFFSLGLFFFVWEEERVLVLRKKSVTDFWCKRLSRI